VVRARPAAPPFRTRAFRFPCGEILPPCTKIIDSKDEAGAKCMVLWSSTSHVDMAKQAVGSSQSDDALALWGRMKIALGSPVVQRPDGTEDLTYRCSGCRIELIATRLMQGDLI
jgi:hypothetical protein